MKRSLVLFPLIATLTACGGSDGDASTPQPTKLASVISGELTAKTADTLTIGGKQTIKVADGADITVPTTSGSKSINLEQLKIGMMLTLKTENNQVNSINYDELLTAPVTNFDATTKNLTMAGMTVITKNAVLEKSLTLDASLKGKLLEISGFAIDGNTIQATYIETEDGNTSELEGMLTDLDVINKTFKLGAVTVNYAQAELPENGLKIGNQVEVEGQLNDQLVLTASKVEDNTADYQDADGAIEVEGIISWVSKDFSHLVMNQNLSVNLSSARFDGISASQLKPGMIIEAEGNWDLNAQNLKATEIEYDKDDNHINDISNLAPEFELLGKAIYRSDLNTITINNQSFILTPRTEVEDIALTELKGQDWVEVEGYEQAGQHIAMEIEYEGNTPTEFEIEGKVISKDNIAQIFGYQANDNSLNKFVGKHVELECTYQGSNTISNCVKDIDD